MSRQACLDHRVDPTCLGFPAGPACLRRWVIPIRFGWVVGWVSSVHLDRRTRLQIQLFFPNKKLKYKVF